MWQKPWIKFYLILILFSVNTSKAKVAPAVGPSTMEESTLLFQNAQSAYRLHQFKEVIRLLSRFIQRYPGTPGYLSAHLMLGRSYIHSQQPRNALAPLKYFIHASGWTEDSLKARLNISRAYYLTGQYQKAMLSAIEVMEPGTRHPVIIPRDIFNSGLLQKSWAHIGLKQHRRAKQTLDSFFAKFPGRNPLKPRHLATQARRLEIELKAIECSQLTTGKILEEAEVRNRMKARGTCFLETLVPLQSGFKAGDPYWAKQARLAVAKSYLDFIQACNHPPKPPGKRTPIQLKRYKQELVQVLAHDCREYRTKALGMLNDWKNSLPESMVPQLALLIKDLGSY